MKNGRQSRFACWGVCLLGLMLPACNTMRRDVARVESQVGPGSVRIEPQMGPSPPVQTVSQPVQVQPGMVMAQPAAGVPQPQPVYAQAGAAPVPGYVPQTVAPVQTPAPVAVAPVPTPQPVYAAPAFSNASTGSSFVPAGAVAAPPMTGSPIPVSPANQQFPIATTGAQTAEIGSGFLSNNMPGLQLQPKQPPPAVMRIDGSAPPTSPTVPATPLQPRPETTPEPPLTIPPPPNGGDLGARNAPKQDPKVEPAQSIMPIEAEKPVLPISPISPVSDKSSEPAKPAPPVLVPR